MDVEVRRAVVDGLLADALVDDRRRFLVAAAVVAGGPMGTGEDDDNVISRDSSLVKSTTWLNLRDRRGPVGSAAEEELAGGISLAKEGCGNEEGSVS